MSYLYADNTFRFAGITEYWCFRRRLIKQNLDLIQNVHLQFSYTGLEVYPERDLTGGIPPYNLEWWNMTWTDIATIQNLKFLRLDIHKHSWRATDRDERLFFSPLKDLPDHVDIDARCTWGTYHLERLHEESWPFKLTRRAAYHEHSTLR